MDCIETIERRRSIRKFKNDDIGKENINILLNAAQAAPSAGNMQGRDFIIVTDRTIKRELVVAAHNQHFIASAPVIIVAVANIRRSSGRYGNRGELFSIQDATASVVNMMLAATSMGLGTCWIGAFDEDNVRDILNIPIGERPVAMIPIGYPDEDPVMPQRMDMDQIIHREKW
jgi:nitroreductase